MKAPTVTELVSEAPFRLDHMAFIAPPEGSKGPWFRYVITQGPNKINGQRAGTQLEVQRLLDEMVERLNLRQLGHRKKK